jgi:protein regulator of cytokinesis 1
MDFLSTVTEVHPSLDDSVGDNCKSISNDTLSKLDKTVATLNEDKKLRLSKVNAHLLVYKCELHSLLTCTISPLAFLHSQLQELAGQLYDLWDLMDAPKEERRMFDHVTCNRSASVDEVTAPGSLALDLIEEVSLSNNFLVPSPDMNYSFGLLDIYFSIYSG